MKNLKKIALIVSLLLLGQNLFASEVFKNFNQGRFDSEYQVNFFKTDANFAADGAQQSLLNGNTFQIIDAGLEARYVLIKDLGLFAGLNVGSSESNDAFATRRNSSLNFVHLGADYNLLTYDWMDLYVDLSYHHAIEKIASDTDSALNSDGASEVHADTVMLFSFDYIKPFAAIGVNYRMEGLSTLLTYAVGAESHFDSFILGAALNGFASVVDDSKTSSTFERDFIINRVNAGSKKYASINPNHLDSDLYMKYIFNEDFSFKVNGGYSVIGSNSAVGYHVGAAFNWGFGGGEARRQSHPVDRSKKTTAQPAKKFQEDTNDGVNQDYFKPVKPSNENYIDEVSPSKSGTKAVEATDDEMQMTTKKTLSPNDPEYKIKLKKKKKKTP